MIRKYALFVCAAILLAATVSLHGQSCDSNPAWYYAPKFTCDTNGGTCRPGQPITFELTGYYTSASASCVTGTWQFADGTVQAAGNAPFPRTLPVGVHQIPVSMLNPAYSSTPYATSVTVTVARGYVQFPFIGSLYVTEGGSATFSVNRTNVEAATEVSWIITDTYNGTTPTTAVSPSSGTVSLAAGAVSQSFNVSAPDDSVFTGEKTYYARLTSATNGYLPYNYTTTLNVSDNDYAIVAFASPAMTVREDAGVVTIQLTRTGNLANAFSVNWAVPGSSSIVGANGSLSFASGETSKSFTAAIINDTQWTGNRTVNLQLFAAGPGAKFPNDSGGSSMSLKIEEDEPAPKITVSNVSVAEGDAGTKTMTFTVKISQGLYLSLYGNIVPKTAQYGSDYIGNTFQYISFSPTVTEGTVSIEVKGDTVLEGHETLALHFDPNCCSQEIALPPDAIGTILNDETAIDPSNVRVAKGKTAKILVDIGVPAATPQVLPLVLSEPGIVTAPQSLRFETGQSRASFEVTGAALGSASVRIQLPPAHGGEMLSTRVTVHDSSTAVFEPGSVLTFPGEESTVRVTLEPPSAQQQRILLVSGNANVVTVPSEVIIPAGGSGTFKAKGGVKGATFIKATLPAEFGSFVMNVLADVVEKPATPFLASIVPATGPTSGGTAFEARGALLTADCTLLFGGVPATAVTLNAEGALTGVTPAHTNGTVDVTLRCGASQFALTNAFTYVGSSPSITAVAPGFGATGGGTHVRATVANVRSGCWMFFDGVAAPYVWINGAAEMTAVTPYRSAAGNVDVMVRCGNDSATLDDAFSYSTTMEPSLSLLTVSPLSGVPGQPVTIHGSRLRPTDRVAFDGVDAALLQTRPESHTVRIPELPPGKSAITLVDAEGRLTTTGPIFTIKETAPPYIGSITPSTTPAGGEVALEGRGLRPGFTFVIGGHAARIVSLDYEHAVLRLTGALAPGRYAVDVRDASQHLAASGPDLTIAAAGVVIRGVTASCDTTDGGARVTIRGSGFAPGATATFNGVAASVELVSETELRATTPPGATGFARVAVTNPNGDTGAISDAFRYRSPFDPAGCAPSRGRGVRH